MYLIAAGCAAGISIIIVFSNIICWHRGYKFGIEKAHRMYHDGYKHGVKIGILAEQKAMNRKHRKEQYDLG